MGLRGPLKTVDPARGNPGRRPPEGPKLSPKVAADAQVMYDELKALGDREMAKAKKGGKGAPAALALAIKCWHEALHIAYRLGGVVAAPEKNKLEAHLARRQRVVALPQETDE